MLTVIIPTFRRASSLKRTLDSLQQQNLENFTVIVVDNAGEDEIENLIRQRDNRSGIHMHYLRHTQGGNSGARNRGALEAKTGLLVFTDDDLTFDPGWLTAYHKAFSDNPEMIAAGGCVKPEWEINPPEWLVNYINDRKVIEIFALVDQGQEINISTRGFFFSNNMAIRRSVFKWTGFRPEIYGTQTIGNGETGLNQELSQNNYQIGYIPGAIAYHFIPGSRMTVDYIRKWAWHLGGAEMFKRWSGQKRNIFKFIRETLYIFKKYISSWVTSLCFKKRKDPESINVLFQASLGWCKINYLWWMMVDKKVKDALDMKDFRP